MNFVIPIITKVGANFFITNGMLRFKFHIEIWQKMLVRLHTQCSIPKPIVSEIMTLENQALSNFNRVKRGLGVWL